MRMHVLYKHDRLALALHIVYALHLVEKMQVVVVVVVILLPLVACIERRQNDALATAATSDKCNRIIREYSCEKSDYSQGVADVFLSCGPNFAPNAALVNVACAVNENGDSVLQRCLC